MGGKVGAKVGFKVGLLVKGKVGNGEGAILGAWPTPVIRNDMTILLVLNSLNVSPVCCTCPQM